MHGAGFGIDGVAADARALTHLSHRSPVEACASEERGEGTHTLHVVSAQLLNVFRRCRVMNESLNEQLYPEVRAFMEARRW